MKKTRKLILMIVGILFLSLLLYKYVFFVIVVPSASMYPTIKIGDRIVTTRIHDFSFIERGDVLVFYSDELEETMVKRVIGLPGDKVEIDSDGAVIVNNQIIDEPYVKYGDKLSGTYRVPDEKYFFLGDAREYSYDSRKWDNPYISEENIRGKARFILY